MFKYKIFKGQNPAEETFELQNIRPTARNSKLVNHMIFQHIQLVSHCGELGSNPRQPKWDM